MRTVKFVKVNIAEGKMKVTRPCIYINNKQSFPPSLLYYLPGIPGKYVLSYLALSASVYQVNNEATFIRAMQFKVYWIALRTTSQGGGKFTASQRLRAAEKRQRQLETCRTAG